MQGLQGPLKLEYGGVFCHEKAQMFLLVCENLLKRYLHTQTQRVLDAVPQGAPRPTLDFINAVGLQSVRDWTDAAKGAEVQDARAVFPSIDDLYVTTFSFYARCAYGVDGAGNRLMLEVTVPELKTFLAAFYGKALDEPSVWRQDGNLDVFHRACKSAMRATLYDLANTRVTRQTTLEDAVVKIPQESRDGMVELSSQSSSSSSPSQSPSSSPLQSPQSSRSSSPGIEWPPKKHLVLHGTDPDPVGSSASASVSAGAGGASASNKLSRS